LTPTSIHLVVGTPCYGRQVTSAYLSSVLKLQEACRREQVPLTLLMPDGDDLVQRSRQEIVADFMAIGSSTHLLFIDADISFEPGQVFRLLRFGADVAAAAYPLKRINWEKVRAGAQTGSRKLDSAGLDYAVEWKKPLETRKGFGRAELAGTGFFMAQRRVFQALMDRHPELRYSKEGAGPYHYALFNCLIDGKEGPYLSEDYSFCRRWTGMGGEIWVDLKSRVDHTGASTFAGDLDTAFREGKAPL